MGIVVDVRSNGALRIVVSRFAERLVGEALSGGIFFCWTVVGEDYSAVVQVWMKENMTYPIEYDYTELTPCRFGLEDIVFADCDGSSRMTCDREPFVYISSWGLFTSILSMCCPEISLVLCIDV